MTEKISRSLENIFVYGDSDFFSASFSKRRIFKEILTLRYGMCEEKWINRINEGIIYSSADIRKSRIRQQAYLEDICKKYGDQLEIGKVVAFYKEKYRNKSCCILTYDNILYIHGRLYMLDDLQIDKIYGIGYNDNFYPVCISESFQKLIYDSCLINNYNEEADISEEFNHPLRNISHNSKERYFKLLILFFFMNGYMSVRQIFHIINIAKCFEMTSKIAEEIIQRMFELSNIEKRILWDELIKAIDNDQKNCLPNELIYMVYIGNYSEEEQDNKLKVIAAELNVDINKVSNISKQIIKLMNK